MSLSAIYLHFSGFLQIQDIPLLLLLFKLRLLIQHYDFTQESTSFDCWLVPKSQTLSDTLLLHAPHVHQTHLLNGH